MLRCFVREYIDGVTSSLYGFVTLFKLDAARANALARAAEASQQRASSAEPSARPTVLERRRQQQKRADSHTAQLAPPVRTKASAVQRVAQLIGLNLIIIALLQLLFWFTEWLVPSKDSLLYTICAYFRITLIMPVFVVIRILSALWFADVASAACLYRGTPPPSRDAAAVNLSLATADFVHSIVAELLVLVQATFLSSLPMPVLAPVASFVNMSLLHSLYSFEYMWLSCTVAMKQRHDKVERHWPYHLGFGTLLTVLTSLSSSFVVNSCVFGALFPFFIVSSFLASSPDHGQTEIPPLPVFYLAERVTAKLSSTLCKALQG